MDIKKEKRRRKLFSMRNLIFSVVVIIVVGTYAGVSNLSKALPSVTKANLWIDTSKRGDMVHEVRAYGTLAYENLRWVTSQVNGTIKERLCEPGTEVKADSVILKLENPVLESALKKAQANWNRAQAVFEAKRSELKLKQMEQDSIIAGFEADYEIKRIEAKSTEAIYPSGIVSELELQRAQISSAQAKKLLLLAKQRKNEIQKSIEIQLRAAEAVREQAKIELAIAEKDVESLYVKAGIDGIVQNISVEPGREVTAGASIALVAKPKPLRGLLRVPEMLAKDLNLGLKVLVDIHNRKVEGRVSQIDPSVTNGSVLLYVSFDSELPNNVRADTSIEGKIMLKNIADVISIARPSSANSNSVGKLFVLVPGSNVARRKEVRYGALSSNRVQVISGLEAGEQVIVSDLSQWSDQDAIQLE
ncbi:efflux RND transporter periplasmic adaptor subunit [Idiomarina xiamenensis]|uniref:RND family efflux transporter MFP subunit n=1 Tax=Idiomarina xiamenensis 10-D-4 TaxID=740709 RepID=K2JUY1_9GAMM|nr:efflux RND transporter periplasmic adaptor subunit [Idiomarina xiamenensis]EKE79323.1 RND family efflux transporter MFP subunit [Idiomarina xiamenensis 10-D-4]